MRAYEEAFSGYGLKVAQILLTRDDLANRRRFQNARGTLDTLLACGIIPVINENDTVVVDELKFGDNDNLSALVTNLVEAQLLLIMTDIDGLYTADPRTDPGCDADPPGARHHARDGARRRRQRDQLSAPAAWRPSSRRPKKW